MNQDLRYLYNTSSKVLVTPSLLEKNVNERRQELTRPGTLSKLAQLFTVRRKKATIHPKTKPILSPYTPQNSPDVPTSTLQSLSKFAKKRLDALRKYQIDTLAWYKTLDQATKDALKDYVVLHKVPQMLRIKKGVYQFRSEEDYRLYVRMYQALITCPRLPARSTLYRGVQLSRPLQVGSVILPRNGLPVSTSLRSDTAESFALNNGAVLEIKAHRGTRGIFFGELTVPSYLNNIYEERYGTINTGMYEIALYPYKIVVDEIASASYYRCSIHPLKLELYRTISKVGKLAANTHILAIQEEMDPETISWLTDAIVQDIIKAV